MSHIESARWHRAFWEDRVVPSYQLDIPWNVIVAMQCLCGECVTVRFPQLVALSASGHQ